MLKKIILTSVFIFAITLIANAQTPDSVKYWENGGFASLTFNQVSLSNWVAGGENAVSTTLLLSLHANYKKDKIAWDNSLDLGYGILKSGDSKFKKNEDKINLLSKFGYEAVRKLYYSFLVNYRTQFTKGYNYPNDSVVVSKFNAPAYLSLSFGIDYKPNSFISVFISPITGKFTIVSDKTLSDLGMYGVDPGKKFRAEFGAGLNAQFQKDVLPYINILSKLVLFDNYMDKDKNNRTNIDVNWELMINIKAGKFLTTSIFTNLIYDHNIIKRTQFKEVLGVGLSYKF